MRPTTFYSCLLLLLLGNTARAWDLCKVSELACSSPTPRRACHCDNVCRYMDDCCQDYDGTRSAEDTNPANETLNLAAVPDFRGHFECHSSTGNSTYRTRSYLPMDDFLYVKDCPSTFQDMEIKNLCEDVSGDIFFEWLVTSRESKVTYRNVYCSLCWGETDVQRWRLEYSCQNESDPINPKLPDGTPTGTGIDRDIKCHPLLPVDSGGRPGASTPVQPPGHAEDKPDGPLMPGTDNKPPGSNAPRPPGTPGGQPGVRSKRATGDHSEDASISEGDISKSDLSKDLGLQTDRHHDEQNVKNKHLKLLPPPVIKFTTKFFSRPNQERVKRSPESIECKPTFVYPFCDNLRPCSDLETVATCRNRWNGTKVEETCMRGPFGRMKMTTDGKNFRNVHCVVCNELNPEIPVCGRNPNKVQGPEGGTPPPLSLIFDPEAGKLIKEVRGKRISIPLPKCRKGQVLDVFAYICRDIFCPKGYKLISGVCTKYADTTETVDGDPDVCRWIQFYVDEFEMSTNNSIVLTATGHVLPLDERAITNLTNSSVLVCENMLPYGWNSSKITFNYSEGTVVLSILLQIVSLLCLLTQFIVYLILPELRNTPGLSIMSLVVALFYAQFLLLISGTAPGHRSGCIFIGVAIHYFFLASFCWMASLALDMTLTFSSRTINFGDEKSKLRRFFKFSLFCWIVPLAIVCLAFLTDMGQSDTYPFNPGYGQGFCWITNKQGLWLWFLSPVAVLLCACIAMYILTVYFIVQATQAARLAHKDDKLYLFLYIKLSLIMGLTWILGFIWIGTKDIVTEYLFIVFNSLQGAFIFLAFVCRRKVFRLLRWKRSKRKPVSSSRPTSTSRLSTISNNRKSMI